MRQGFLLALLWGGAVAFSASPAAAVTLPTVIGDNMVLQREQPVVIWGGGDPGEVVTVSLSQNQAAATTDADGRWMVKLPALPAGGPHNMTIVGKETIALKNILVGEVWFCSGQSNMEWSLSAAANGQAEVAAADFPLIRLFDIPKVPAGAPSTKCDAAWTVCTPQTAATFSAVAYFFGRQLRKELDVPIGLIDSSWGGTKIEAWTSLVGLRSDPKLAPLAEWAEQTHARFVADSIEVVKKKAEWLPIAQKAIAEGKEIPDPPFWPVDKVRDPRSATSLYNGMVHPVVPFTIRGAIWYQGESNIGEGMQYFDKMKALIAGWRQVWGQGDFPFYYVQLAPFRYDKMNLLLLPGIWEAQTAALAIPNTGMAVTVDIGNVLDVHPRNKQEVGRRLALLALAKTYGRETLVCSGPMFKSAEVQEGKIRVTFENVGGGLASRDGQPLTWFTIAGSDLKFQPAQAVIDGDSVVVQSEAIADPVAVRFAWHNEAEPNLMNKEGLPAAPFRTDK